MEKPENSKKYMLRAIELAKKGEGHTNPNPLVGAVIVKDGKIIGEGYHHIYGSLHAEREALKDCREKGNNPEGATIFVTLEPCCHQGKQPPCTHALVEAKLSHVVVGSRDPNPLVHGKGNEYLRQNGIKVTEDFLRDECDELNPVFFHYITTKLPFVCLKYAMTLDGKIATKSGASKWISNERSREFGHVLRNKYSAILAGIGTVLSDDPLLNCRLSDEAVQKFGLSHSLPVRNPVRVICDSDLRLPLDSRIVQTAKEIQTIVACAEKNRSEAEKALFEEKKSALEKEGVEIVELLRPSSQNDSASQSRGINLKSLMKVLGEKSIDSVLIEGGAEINYAALKSGIVNKLYAFVAPKIFGGKAKTPIEGDGVKLPEEAFQFKLEKITDFDGDLLLEYTN